MGYFHSEGLVRSGYDPVENRSHSDGSGKADSSVEKDTQDGFYLFVGMGADVSRSQKIAAYGAGEAIIVKQPYEMQFDGHYIRYIDCLSL